MKKKISYNNLPKEIQEVLSQAREKIRARADEYQVKADVCYVCNDNFMTGKVRQDYNYCETYCEDCIDSIIENLNKEYPNAEFTYTYEIESSPEYEGMLYCDNCGELINVAVLWNMETIEQWLGLTKQEWVDVLKCPHNCYELRELLDKTYGAIEGYPEECLVIAYNILIYSNQIEEQTDANAESN